MDPGIKVNKYHLASTAHDVRRLSIGDTHYEYFDFNEHLGSMHWQASTATRSSSLTPCLHTASLLRTGTWNISSP